MTTDSTAGPAHHPEVAVDIRDAEARPLAAIALVRRELQRAGHAAAAAAFSEQALAASPQQIRDVAGRYVTVL